MLEIEPQFEFSMSLLTFEITNSQITEGFDKSEVFLFLTNSFEFLKCNTFFQGFTIVKILFRIINKHYQFILDRILR